MSDWQWWELLKGGQVQRNVLEISPVTRTVGEASKQRCCGTALAPAWFYEMYYTRTGIPAKV